MSSTSDTTHECCSTKDYKYAEIAFTSADNNLATLAVIIEGNSLNWVERHRQGVMKKW